MTPGGESKRKRVKRLHREAQLLAVIAYNAEHNPPAYIRRRIERTAKMSNDVAKLYVPNCDECARLTTLLKENLVPDGEVK